MIDLCGATLAPGTIDVDASSHEPRVLRLREARVERLLGTPVPKARQVQLLEALGFAVADAPDGLDVSVPHFRLDVTREVDLVEEVARFDLETLPATLPSRQGAVGVLAPEQRIRRRVEDALVGAGLYEVVGWSFTSEQTGRKLALTLDPVRLRNPMSEEQAVMRTHLLSSLLDVAERNLHRGHADLRLFEVGAVYLPWAPDRPRPPGRWDPPAGTRGRAAWDEGTLPDERLHVGALVSGALRPASWREPAPPRADFFAVKGILEAVGAALRVPLSFEPATEAFLHPGRSARVLANGVPAGWVGEVHPRVAARWDLPDAAAFEVDLAILAAHATTIPAFRDLPAHPVARRDLALVVDDDQPAAAVLAAARRAAGALLEDVGVFDVYRGGQVGEGRKSIGLRLAFRAPDRTLTDEEVDALLERVVSDLGAERRA
jgi:phenylalanyl-tRNA synthetase beta chain